MSQSPTNPMLEWAKKDSGEEKQLTSAMTSWVEMDMMHCSYSARKFPLLRKLYKQSNKAFKNINQLQLSLWMLLSSDVTLSVTSHFMSRNFETRL